MQKSYDGTPILYLVPTPIGNLDDITLRAIKILKESVLILAEDTRITKKLLNYLQIKTKVICSNKDNEFKNINFVLQTLKNGNNVALVTDRGTPLISDPGNIIVNEVIKNSFNVVCLPGACALIPGIVMSGLDTSKFLFYGFLNSKETYRKKELISLKDEKNTIIFYESPHRLDKTLKNIYEIFGNRKISLIREISKLYEEVIRDNLENIINNLENIKGEYLIVIEGNKTSKDYSDISIIEHYNNYLNLGYNKKEAIKKVAQDRKINKNEVYQIVIRG